MNIQYQTVTQITHYIKEKMESDLKLHDIIIRGEVTSLSNRGHIYFTLKDTDKCSLKAILFTSHQNRSNYMPSEGDDVLVFGDIEVYPFTGQYQIIIRDIMRYGDGKRSIELEQLRKKLQLEGLFAEERKRKLPAYPTKIGVITASNGAAVHDIYQNIMKRYPLVNITLFPSAVQGKNAPAELLEALGKAIKSSVDVIIIGRGGGDNDDLSAFNDESLVRAVYHAPIPIVAAVGHESDYTLIDYVADKRASTPTEAAILVTPNMNDLLQVLDGARNRLNSHITARLMSLRQKITILRQAPLLKSPDYYFIERQRSVEKAKSTINTKIEHRLRNTKMTLDNLSLRLGRTVKNKLSMTAQELKSHASKLMAINPLAILSRGYSITLDENGRAITSIENIKDDQIVKTILKNGRMTSKVTAKEHKIYGSKEDI